MPTQKALILILITIGLVSVTGEVRGQTQAPAAAPVVEAGSKKTAANASQQKKELAGIAQELAKLTQAQAQAKEGDAPELDRMKAQLELQQKEIEVLLRMTQLLAGKVEEQPASVEAVEKLQEQAAVQESRIQQARGAIGSWRGRAMVCSSGSTRSLVPGRCCRRTRASCSCRRRTNESPLSIYGMLSEDFDTFSQQKSTFRPPTIQLHPYLLLNERWMLSANLIFLSSSLTICRMQADYFINDSLTFVGGRFYSPIGFYSERIRLDWVQKTPDAPLMFNQVYPQNLFFDGVQLRGSRYLLETGP